MLHTYPLILFVENYQNLNRLNNTNTKYMILILTLYTLYFRNVIEFNYQYTPIITHNIELYIYIYIYTLKNYIINSLLKIYV